ncbi:unnamed protein product [Toxocara canis]|uniref:Aa_trans domain-containing protein n=1 Tax=Toxocara canis TaxID=6265 RepID=A0A183UDM0_TOXCA|nr:unnamed protein product [Toxocara canis]
MLVSSDALDAYSIAALAGAPVAHLLSQSLLAWPVIFILFTLPAFTLLINLGHVSGAGPVLTFARIAPIASGVGWALTWLAGERLFVQSLIAAQNFLYLIYSLRTRLHWALDCDHSYNNNLCVDFLRQNVSHGEAQHQPDNNWPAQQFNRFGVRGVPLERDVSVWTPNAWYFGEPSIINKFSIDVPPLPLTISHLLIWLALFLIVHKFGTNPGWFLIRFCLLFPLGLFTVLLVGLSIFGFSFYNEVEKEIRPDLVEKYPFEYFSEIHGFYRTTIVLMDYSSAFTGIIIFASSKIRSGNMPMSALALLTAQVLAPTFLYVLRHGCDGHLALVQPAYESYTATDATFSFDTAAVCFATTSGGPLWAVLYYTANLLYACIGPMAVLLLFINNSFHEQFPFLENFTSHILAVICTVFALTGLLLCMPVGGWHNLDADVHLQLSSGDTSSPLLFFPLGPTSPLFTVLLFTSTKFASVFDLLMGGMDIVKHVDYGTAFISKSLTLNRIIGYCLMLAPSFIIIAFAFFAFYRNAIVFKMPWGAVLDATADWNWHASLRQPTTLKTAPLSHRIFTSLTSISYRTVLFGIFIVEIFVGITLLVLFFTNAVVAQLQSHGESGSANNYRTVMFLIFLTFHILSLFEIRWALKRWDHSSRLNMYIGVATMEIAFLNGYMWMFALDHSWGPNFIPFLVIFVNTAVRGTILAIVIAIRWSMAELSHPTRTRDATEIYDATADLDADVDREDDAPIIYEMRRDVFS